ncbi:MAG: hypothetical protein CM15mP84_08440 [Cellvibrionales bacterium]|nr:MAG: hypothetical protein CM15mP84_08440 [Cellvibrionales bacterium]
MAKAIESGIPKLRIEEAAAKNKPALTVARMSLSASISFKSTSKTRSIFLRSIMNRSGAQLARLATIRESRDDSRVSEALSALTAAANLGRGIYSLPLRRRAPEQRWGDLRRVGAGVRSLRGQCQTVSGVYGAATRMMPNGRDCDGY